MNQNFYNVLTTNQKMKKNDNEILKFKPGFLVKAIEEGKTVVLDYINKTNSSVCEKLNYLIKIIMKMKNILIP